MFYENTRAKKPGVKEIGKIQHTILMGRILIDHTKLSIKLSICKSGANREEMTMFCTPKLRYLTYHWKNSVRFVISIGYGIL